MMEKILFHFSKMDLSFTLIFVSIEIYDWELKEYNKQNYFLKCKAIYMLVVMV